MIYVGPSVHTPSDLHKVWIRWCLTRTRAHAKILDVRQEPLPELMSAEEVATALRVSSWTVLRWFREGKVPGLKISGTTRFRREDIERMLEGPERVA